MGTTEELIERVRLAQGPDRELDIAFCCAFPMLINATEAWPEAGIIRYRHNQGTGHRILPERVTGSVDASLWLIDRLLRPEHPHMTASLNGGLNKPHDYWRAEITWPSHEVQGHATTAPLALLIAFLIAFSKRGAS